MVIFHSYVKLPEGNVPHLRLYWLKLLSIHRWGYGGKEIGLAARSLGLFNEHHGVLGVFPTLSLSMFKCYLINKDRVWGCLSNKSGYVLNYEPANWGFLVGYGRFI
jgi:hypothetical protein